MNKTLFGKILLMSLLVLLIVSGVTAVIMDYFVERYVFESNQGEMTRLGQRVARNTVDWLYRRDRMMGSGGMNNSMMRGMWVNRVADMIRDLEQVLDVRIWLIDEQGQIYVKGNISGRRQLSASEMQQLARGENLTFSNWSDEGDQAILAVAVPMQEKNQFVGGIFIIKPMRELYLIQRQIRRVLLLPTFLGGLIAVILVFFFSRRLVKPIREMQQMIHRMRQGDFTGQIEVERDDELGQLAQHFNEMSGELDETIALLRNEQEQTQRIINSMAEGVISLNQERDVVMINPAAGKILGIGSEAQDVGSRELIGKIPEVEEQVDQVEEEKRSVVREIEGDGQVLLSIASPILTEDKQVLGVVVVLQDITQRWRLIQMQKDLVANVSHEFKTPLTSIQGFVELLLDQKITDASSLEGSLKIIHSETLRLIRMVNDLLGMAKVTNMRLEKKWHGLAELVQGVTESLSFKLEESQVEVVLEPALEDLRVPVDQARMEQVFYNLLDNAIRFSLTGGKIIVVGREDARMVEIQIRDQGPGIPEAKQNLIFDRFYKVEKARSTNTSGTGLGLAIVKNIVEEHGGQITVANHPDGGAVFTIRLPKDD